MEYLTPKMVSEKLHIGMNKVYKLFKTRGFPGVKLTNQWIVEASDLKKFLDEYQGSGVLL